MAALLARKVMAAVGGPLRLLSRQATTRPPALGAGPWAAEPGGPRPGGDRPLLWRAPLPALRPAALGFKTKGVLRKRCKDCYFVKRRGRWFILCKSHPRHKQRQMQ
ncbi:39S ribosomal protein L36, mitochondrial [Ornithorhynchus anatinus]|uniref:39S ribosomal protein L36, mitochondrial n=1 Tax=Ornithorhynchus anatinus TaxID=9258 RepID=UPI0010A838CC|nr:39S ribosomal protein L36, mitochondrial [Ornithorhynchus anatinus]